MLDPAHYYMLDSTHYTVCLTRSPGSSNPSMARLLHSLGPDITSSNQHMVDSIIEHCNFGYHVNYQGDSSIITSPPVSAEERDSLLEVTSIYCVY